MTKRAKIRIPDQDDWKRLKESVQTQISILDATGWIDDVEWLM